MRAIILAGGKGTRLKPFTTLIPKPLVPLGGEIAILEVIIQQLKRYGFNHITLAINHLANLIRAYIGNGEKWDIQIDYSLEEEPLGTIGPLTLIEDLPENFLVMNGDILSDLHYGHFLEEHAKSDCLVSIASCKRENQIDFGIVHYDPEEHHLISFEEKPTYHFNVSMGIYCFHRSAVERLSKGEKYGFDDLMLDAIKNKDRVSIRPFKGFWLDIGRPEDYEHANTHYQEIRTILNL